MWQTIVVSAVVALVVSTLLILFHINQTKHMMNKLMAEEMKRMRAFGEEIIRQFQDE
ncbi:hypothetical protein [Dolosigranulum pigrum]|uniref:hypothetical protein n=1 Tax=Dolosigranulum pigrum TaxID=29394 RepID=UPI001AD88096|nr:hypothetical protein [Dolosigranulum pigrum]